MDVSTWLTIAVAALLIIFAYYFLNQNGKVSELKNKCVVVTGCDSGFGHELCLVLDSLGLRVFAGCLTEDGETLLQEKCSPRLKTVRMDVTKSEDIESCLGIVRSFIETTDDVVLWAVVNNAGIGAPGPLEWTPMKELKKTFDVNVWGLVEVTKVFLPLLKRSRGRIINVASAAGKVAMPGCAAYSASKFAVQSFTDVFRIELRPFSVTVHTIDPGFFQTNITDHRIHRHVIERLWNNLSQQVRDEYGEDFLHNGITHMEKISRMASKDISQVIDAMVHAITANRPKTRYVIGWDHRLLWRWVALLPSEILDFVMSLSYPKSKPGNNWL